MTDWRNEESPQIKLVYAIMLSAEKQQAKFIAIAAPCVMFHRQLGIEAPITIREHRGDVRYGREPTMNQIRIILVIGVGISLLYSLIKLIVLRMPGRSRDSARKRMAQARWLDADSRDGALVKVTGTVRTRETGDRFVSPLTESRCVALHMRALVRRGRSPRGELVEKLQIKPFVIDDDGSKVLVEATHALFDLSPARPPKTADVRKLLAEVGYQDANASTSRCEETVVEVGATVTVAGTLVTSPAIALIGDEANPIVIRKERVYALANEP